MDTNPPRQAIRLFFLLLLSLATTAAALDGRWAITQYAHEAWRIRDGLPQSSVSAVVQTPDGYLWIGTEAGLARFDGVRFTVFDSGSQPALENHRVNALAVDTGGRLWIGTSGGLVRYEEGRFVRLGEADGLPDNQVTVLEPTADGGLWIGTYGGGGARLDDGRFIPYTTAQGLLNDIVLTVVETRDGDVWIGSQPGGLNLVRDGVVAASYTTEQGLSSDLVLALAEDARGDLWIGTITGLDRFRNGVFEPFAEAAGLGGSSVFTLAPDRDGNLWVGTSDAGLVRFDGRGWSAFNSRDGLTSDSIGALFEDRLGNLWIGTDGGGLNRLKEGVFRSFGRRQGLHANRVMDVYQDRLGRVWLGTWGGGLSRLEEDVLETFTPAQGLPSGFVATLTEDAAGNVWFGTPNGAHRYVEEGAFPTISSADGLLGDAVYELYAARDKSLWIATNGGLSRVRDGRVTTFTTEDGLPSNQVRALGEDVSGRLWAGAMTGLASLAEDGRFVAVPELDGVYVQALHVDGDTLWLATVGSGLWRLRGGRSVAFTTREGLPDDTLCWLTDDRFGRLWVSSSKGIFQLDKDELEAFAGGRAEGFSATVYDTADGLPSSVCYRNHGGRVGEEIWFQTSAGVAVLDPQRVEASPAPQRVRIEEVLIDERPSGGGRVEVPAGAKTVELRYTVLDSPEPRRARFRVRLEGFDDTWTEVGARRNAFYTNLSPGSYRFRVEASRTDGSWGTEGAELDLRVAPALYQTWPFYLACAAAAAALGWVVHRLRMGPLERYTRTLEQMKEELEAKNAELERFTYTVSHDLKSPLVTILGFLGALTHDVETDNRERIRGDVDHIRRAAETMHQQLDELLELSRIGRVVHPPEEVDLGELAFEAVRLLHGEIVRREAEVVVPPRLPRVRGDRARLLEVMQNLIENALRYGRPGVPPRVEVDARRDGREVVCRVRDNGIGIEPRYHEKVWNLFERLDPAAGEGTGIGLALVRRIVEVHGGRVWIESEGTGRGSTFCFTLPCEA